LAGRFRFYGWRLALFFGLFFVRRFFRGFLFFLFGFFFGLAFRFFGFLCLGFFFGFARDFFAGGDDFIQPRRAFVRCFLQFLGGAVQFRDLVGHRVGGFAGAAAVAFRDQRLDFVEIGVDLTRGRAWQEVIVAAAGREAHRKRGGDGEGGQHCAQASHG